MIRKFPVKFEFIGLWALMMGLGLAQDPAEIVNALTAHSDECGVHDWLVLDDTSSNCGSDQSCSFPQSWCSQENGIKCVALPKPCRQKLLQDLKLETTASETESTTEPVTTSSSAVVTTTTQPGPVTTTQPVPVTTTQVPLTTSAEPVPTSTGTTQLPVTTSAEPSPPAAVQTSTSPPTIARRTAKLVLTTTTTTTTTTTAIPEITGEPPVRPLPVGKNGTLVATFKVVGGTRPSCSDNSNFCCYWARNGDCNDNAYFMQTYCRRSCDALRGPVTVGDDLVTVGDNAFGQAPGQCLDLHRKCRFWANRGECKRNFLFMFSMCRPACGLCPPCCKMTCSGGGSYGSYGYAAGGCQRSCGACGR